MDYGFIELMQQNRSFTQSSGGPLQAVPTHTHLLPLYASYARVLFAVGLLVAMLDITQKGDVEALPKRVMNHLLTLTLP